MAAPPVEAGAAHDATSEAFAPWAVTEDGAPGVVQGVSGAEAEAPEVPTELVAVTVTA